MLHEAPWEDYDRNPLGLIRKEAFKEERGMHVLAIPFSLISRDRGGNRVKKLQDGASRRPSSFRVAEEKMLRRWRQDLRPQSSHALTSFLPVSQ